LSIGERIRAVRKAAGLSQEEVARRGGVSLNIVNRLERGVVQDPHYSTLVGVAKGLDVRVDELTGETDVTGKAGASTGTEPEDIAAILVRLGSPTLYLGDAELPDKLMEASVPEALAISRAVRREVALLRPELRRRFAVAEEGSVDYMHANLLWETAGVRGLAVRWALRTKQGLIPVPIAGRSEEREEIEEEAKELDLALAGAR
jgi:transcriptional regulator with XRE-family HTH domain